MTPEEYCRHKAAPIGSSLYYAFLFLPPEQRRAATALYAFCREVDEAIKEPSDPSVARASVEWWRGEVARLYGGVPQHPVTRALQPALAPCGIRAEELNAILDGGEMDLTQTRYPDFADLARYCRRSAGAVYAVAARIFGCLNPRTQEYAAQLGLAFGLTRVIRDVGPDARKNRIYLPMDELRRFDVPVADILGARRTDSFGELMAFQVERAERFYTEALALLPVEDRRAQRPGLILAAIYRTLLDEIRRDGYRVLDQGISLTPIRKLWIAWRTWITARA